MDRSCVISLISIVRTQDEYGVWRDTESSRQVFAQADSVTRSEFFDAGRAGLNPEYRFTMFYADYQGEETVEYNGKRYGIYRVYQRRDDNVELYAERKGGVNGN